MKIMAELIMRTRNKLSFKFDSTFNFVESLGWRTKIFCSYFNSILSVESVELQTQQKKNSIEKKERECRPRRIMQSVRGYLIEHHIKRNESAPLTHIMNEFVLQTARWVAHTDNVKVAHKGRLKDNQDGDDGDNESYSSEAEFRMNTC